MSVIKIMHVIGSMDLGGAEKLTKLTIEGLGRDEFEMSVCCLKSGGFYSQELLSNGYLVFILLDVGKHCRMTIRNFLRVSWRLFWLLRRERPHIVHAHLFLASCLVRIVGFLAGIRCQVVTVHRIEYPRFQVAVERVLGRLTTRFVTDSISAAGLLTTKLGIDASKVEVIYNGIDTHEFSNVPPRESARHGLGLGEGTFVIGIVAHLFTEKGHDFLFDSLLHARQKLDDFKLLVVGDGYLRENLEKKASDHFESGQILFLGQRADLANLLSAMDLLVLPSSWEGFGIVLTEAMYMQVPVITTRDGGGCAEVVEEEDGGLLVNFGDIDALADAIVKFYVDVQFRRDQGGKGRARVEEKFVAPIMVKGYANMYRRLYRDNRVGSHA